MDYTTLISTSELENNIAQNNWVIFDCRSSLLDHSAGLKAYQTGHIPNALFCSLESDLSASVTKTSGRHPLPDLDMLIKNWAIGGVDKQTQIIAYDDVGGAFAVRLWWQLRTFGHNKVAVLDGGIPQWIKEDKQLTTDVPTTQPKIFKASLDKKAWLSSDEVYQNLSSKDFTVLDARTPERYRGEAEPIDTIAGRIPESINRAFQQNLDEDGLFLKPEELKKQFKPILEKTPNQSAQEIVHLCGSGVTACHNMMAMEIAGLAGSKLYIGSWSEWIRDKARPIAVG